MISHKKQIEVPDEIFKAPSQLIKPEPRRSWHASNWEGLVFGGANGIVSQLMTFIFNQAISSRIKILEIYAWASFEPAAAGNDEYRASNLMVTIPHSSSLSAPLNINSWTEAGVSTPIGPNGIKIPVGLDSVGDVNLIIGVADNKQLITLVSIDTDAWKIVPLVGDFYDIHLAIYIEEL